MGNSAFTKAQIATPVSPPLGGTGVTNNAANTITFSGNFGLTITLGATTSLTLPSSGTVATIAGSQILTNKTIDADSNTITNIENADIKASAAIALSKLAALTASRATATDASGFVTVSATTATELGYVNGVTSAIQTQLNGKQASGTYVTPSAATVFTAQQNFGAQSLTSGTNISWNLATQQVAKLTLATNATLSNPTNQVDGGTYILTITQDGTGNRTLAYGTAYKWPGGTAPTLSTAASAVDIITCVSNGTDMRCVIQKAFS